MKKLCLLILPALITITICESITAQPLFKNANNRLVTSGHSGNSVTVTDWNGDGMDDIVRLDASEIFVEIQRTNNTFETRALGSFNEDPDWAWAMCVSDIDHNGFKDIIVGGNGPAVKVMMVDITGTSSNIINLPGSGFFLQNLTFGDFNNDGWIDIFCCDDNDASHVYVNDGSGNLVPSTIIPTAVNPGVFIGGDPADSGNYGSVWTDFDNDGDMDMYVVHCRQGVNGTTDPRRINRLFVNDSNNTFTEMGAAYGLDIGWQSWTASFGDIDNDADLDVMVTNHDHESQILLNDGTGHYTDITGSTGFDITDITPIESVMEDFDNDGWIDILVAGSNSRYYKNNGNNTFTRINGQFDNNGMESFAIGDLNHDGSIDIYASYAQIYHTPTSIDDVIWLNQGNSNHFFTLDLRGTVSNAGAIGARAKIYGSWGVQIREVRAGESYGTVNSSMLHFGLGQSTVIDSVVISWPAGTSQTIVNPAPDQFLTVREGDCVSPEAIITFTGSTKLCTGQTLVLNAPAGFDYLWSDGSTTQSTVVSAAGEYNVRISTAGNACSTLSKTLIVVYNPDETPVIEPAGVTEFCNGSSVVLNAPPGMQSYLWSNGDTNQSATITQGGSFTVTVQGTCQLWSSTAINVIVHTAADPVAPDVTLPGPGSATLTATGTNISWYDLPAGGLLLDTGNSYTTPVLTDTTVYYAQAAVSYGGDSYNVGLPAHSGSSSYSGSGNTNAVTYFNVLSACSLNSVKVYTDLPGYRLIELRNSSGVLLESAYVDIQPDSQVIMLEWYILPGNNYTIGTNEDTNQVIPGWTSDGPRLKRNSSGVNYPYSVNGILELTGSSQGSSLFYYFYDWQIEMTTYTCLSNRVPVTVNVNSPVGVNDNDNATEYIIVFPNPATDFVNIVSSESSDVTVKIYDSTGRIIKHEIHPGGNSRMDISALASGFYHLNLMSAGTVINYKLLVN